jgi:tetratricopeptide (TPR) repeat protein
LKIFRIKRTDLYLIALIALISIALRVVYYIVVEDQFWFLNPVVDSANYNIWAQNIAKGKIIGDSVFKHSPLYPYFLSIIYLLPGDSVNNAIITQFFISTICSILTYLLARALFSSKIGFISALLSAIYGPALFYESNLLSVTFINIINICLLISIYYSIERKGYINWFITGIIFGLAILARPNILLLGFFLCFFLYFSQRKIYPSRHIITSAVVLFTAALLIISPSIIRNKIVLDEYMLSVNTGGINFYLGNNENASGYHENIGLLGMVAANQSAAAKDIASSVAGRKLTYGETSRFWFKLAIKEITTRPQRWLTLLGRKILLFFNQYEYTTSLNYYIVEKETPYFNIFQLINFLIICPLAVTGMLLSKKSWKDLLPLYSFLIVYLVSNVLLLVSSEYRFAVLPVFYIFSGVTISQLTDQLKNFSLKRVATIAISIFLMASIVSLKIAPERIHKKHLSLGYVNYAGAYRNSGMDEKAASMYKKAMALSTNLKDYAWLTANYALMLLFVGNMDEALKNIEKAYEISPQNTELLTIYSFILTARGNYEKAIRMSGKALNLEPDNIDFIVNSGKTYLWAGMDYEAEKYFRMALQKNPNMQREIYRIKKQIKDKR